jgi:predicted TIM-barrel fold metal-dependent hydrolase
MVIDTESHVTYRVWPVESNPEGSLVEHFRWHEHSGDFLVAEMDRSGVDRAFVIGYDGYDFGYFMERLGGGPDDYWGGRTYARRFAEKYPERLLYVTTLRHPQRFDTLGEVEREFERGAIGLKVFPSYLGLSLGDAALREAYRLCAERRRLLIIGPEDTDPPRTPPLRQYWEELGEVCSELPELRVQINHGGCVELDSADAGAFFELVRGQPNVHVSTSVLSGVGMDWQHGWRYPYPSYLGVLARYVEQLPVTKLLWASDWPWYTHFWLYPQLVDAIRHGANFLSGEEKDLYLGGNAERVLGELGLA